VDLPTPGSPLSRIAAPGTMPPPSTRSNSATPLERRGDSSDVSDVIGRACRPAAGLVASTRRTMPVCAACSVTVPHCWHSPHRPTHFAVVHPHSVQTYAGAEGFREAMQQG
jgi:hypothetical protein